MEVDECVDKETDFLEYAGESASNSKSSTIHMFFDINRGIDCCLMNSGNVA